MSRSHKEQRARLDRKRSAVLFESFNRAHKNEATSKDLLTKVDRSASRECDLRVNGPFEGARYGQQRHMRARCNAVQRRQDRKCDQSPMLDMNDELGLESRPASPARRRGARWS